MTTAAGTLSWCIKRLVPLLGMTSLMLCACADKLYHLQDVVVLAKSTLTGPRT